MTSKEVVTRLRQIIEKEKNPLELLVNELDLIESESESNQKEEIINNFINYTPEPWFAEREVIVAKNGTWIKPYHHDSWEGDRKWPSAEEQEANTKLMAAAPDLLKQREILLAALERIIYWPDLPDTYTAEEMQDIANKAISLVKTQKY